MLLPVRDPTGLFQKPYEVEVQAITSPFLQMRKLRLSKLPKVTQGAKDSDLNVH